MLRVSSRRPVRPQLLHLDGPLRGRTITYDQQRLVLGSAPGSDVRHYEGGVVAPRHAEIFFDEPGCVYHLRALDGQVFVNHRQVEEVILEAGDLLELGRGGPKIRFRTQSRPGSTCKPARYMLGDAAAVRRSSGIRTATRSLTRDLLVHSTPRFRVLLPVIVILLAGAFSYLGGWLGGRQIAREAARGRELSERRFRQKFEDLRTRYEAERRKTWSLLLEDLDKRRAEEAARARVVDELMKRNAAMRRVLDVYSRGVCLIHGVFTVEKEEDGKLRPVIPGDPLRVEYSGSGFLVSPRGHVVTNRHVAEPWSDHARIQDLVEMGLKPRFVRLDVVFPGHEPVAVDPATVRLSEDKVDLAVLQLPEGSAEGTPVLPLYEGEVDHLRGQRVVLLGYPTGVNAMLARAEQDLVDAALEASTGMASLIRELAARNAISPVITQGALNEVKERRLVYDAETTSGGSGGPVFGPDGNVIGVNFAITRDFGGSNFGVPIRFVRKLLPDL